MRTVVPPQFTGEDLQRLLAAMLTEAPVAPPGMPGSPARPAPAVPAHPAPASGAPDAWDERW